MKDFTVTYRMLKECKHSVRMTPNLTVLGEMVFGETLPDIYVTSTIFEKLGITPTNGLMLDITFAKSDQTS
jgi:hypothetical protein